MDKHKILLRWSLWTVVLPLMCALLFRDVMASAVTGIFMTVPHPHGTVKWTLESSHGLLLHLNEISFP